MKKMKILHFDCDDLESPTAGGQAVRTFEINRRLVKMGHEVTVITMRYPGAKNKIKEGIKYKRMGFMSGPKSYISYLALIPYALWSHQYDLVIEDNISPFSLGLSPLYTRKPVIAQIQYFYAKQASITHHFPLWAFEKYGAKIYKNFIVLTQNMANEIHVLNKKAQIEIIPNGIAKIFPKSNNGQNYFLFLGRIEFYPKGLDRLLRIAKTLQKSLPHYKIIIAGTGRSVKKLTTAIHEAKLKNVEYIGEVKNKTKEKILSNCRALFVPSSFETFSLAILEAAAHSKPVISFDIPNLKEIITQKSGAIGLTAAAFDENIFSELAIQLANDHELYNILANNAHRWARQHLWDDVVKKQLQFYESAAKN